MSITIEPTMTSFTCQAILFDLDGTLVDSIAVVDRAWSKWAIRNGFEPALILPQIHGRRSIDSIRALTPHLDVEAEDERMRIEEANNTDGVVEVAGAMNFVASLPSNRWSIVTSGTSMVAKARMKAVGLSASYAVYGEDVENGKPNPEPYLLAASKLGLSPEACLVFEDTAAGIRSGHAAGMKVVAVTSGVDRPDLQIADAIIPDYLHIRSIFDGQKLRIDIGQ